MKILGVSAFYHDSAAAIIDDGKIVIALEEERFSRKKHDNQFPSQSIAKCLDVLGLSINDIDVIAYYEKPLLKFERLLDTFVTTYPHSLRPFIKSIPEWLGGKINVEQKIRSQMGFKKKIMFVPHHLSHAAAAYYTSPFTRSALLIIDGVGEYQTTTLWEGDQNAISLVSSMNFPHSLGLLYSTFTAFLGFKVNEDEYKMMGLSAYGKPSYIRKINQLVNQKPDGSFQLDLSYFSFRENFQMWNSKFEALFGKPRKPEDAFLPRHKNIAASIQNFTEDTVFGMLNHLYSQTKQKQLCYGGGVALNALANGKLFSKTPFNKIHILGSAGDSGAAIGAALHIHHLLFPNSPRHPISSLYLGTSYSNDYIETVLSLYQLTYTKFPNEKDLLTLTSRLLRDGKIIGWFNGRMEFGPRALGNRSIVSRPYPRLMKNKVNKIKRREMFRPFAGSVLQEHVHKYFETPEPNLHSPFMNFCFKVKKDKRQQLSAIVHADQTCRIQTVSKENGRYYRLIQAFYNLTGVPCILNTSFNLKHEPIVEHPRHAVEDFLKTEMDFLVMGDFIVEKASRRE